jgi:hypothetical protein
LKPYHKLRPKEIEALSLILYYEHELSINVSSPELVNQLLFSSETRNLIKDELGGMPGVVFNNLLSSLRKKGIMSKDNIINEALRPPLGTHEDNFKLIFNFDIKDGND